MRWGGIVPCYGMIIIYFEYKTAIMQPTLKLTFTYNLYVELKLANIVCIFNFHYNF